MDIARKIEAEIGLGAQLASHQGSVNALLTLHKVVVGALLRDLAIHHNENSASVANGGESCGIGGGKARKKT